MSTDVSTPSSVMPRTVQTPETPQPVPISTAFLAPRTEATNRSAAPAPGPTGTALTSAARARAAVRASSSAMKSSEYNQLAGFGGVTIVVGLLIHLVSRD